jgi:glucose/arabinose dehydrogenase
MVSPRSLLVFFVAVAALTVLGVAARTPLDSRRITAAAAPEVELVTLASGLPGITSIVHAGDSRLFLTEQIGRVMVWDGSSVLPTPLLDVTSLVSCCQERGLLSVAFHPSYAQTGLFFIDYTNTAGDTVIARYHVSASDPNRADPASAVVLLTIQQPFANHNGGELQFGPDGYLYIGMGDGGSANDPMCNAQRDTSLLGKLLRIDVDSNAASAPFYSVPPDNPFRPGGGPPNEVWAKGLRNPWRFSFDRATGDLWIGDVGQDEREEIDVEPHGSAGGRNYGWKLMEGTICGAGGSSGCSSPAPPPCNSPDYTAPVFEYSHSSGDCSVTGGYVYRGSAMPGFAGLYFYGDFCTGRLLASGRVLAARAANLSTFGEDMSGELYLATTGGLFARLTEFGVTPTPTPLPTLTPTPAPPPDRAPVVPPAGPRRPSPREVLPRG